MSDRALRERYEALQVRERRAREALDVSDGVTRDEAAHLGREVDALEKSLSDGEARSSRVMARRPVSQRVAAFGFQVLFVAPIVSMLGVAMGRKLRHQDEAAVLSMVVGLVVVLAWVVRPLRTRLLRRGAWRWRVVREARALLAEAPSLPSGETVGVRGRR